QVPSSLQRWLLCRCLARKKLSEKEKEVKKILAKLDQQIPNVSFSDTRTTTSPEDSKAILLNQKDNYCVGEQLMVLLDMFDHMGKRKAYGGDFFKVRIYSPSIQAGASGHIMDYRNGTYLVSFTLLWEGPIRVSLLLMHPSEGVSALWKARKKVYDKIAFTGKYLNGTSEVSVECGFVMNTSEELCKYLDERDEEAFYCLKPGNIPCEAFVQLMSKNSPISYLTALEMELLDSIHPGVEIPQKFGQIQVSVCTTEMSIQKCNFGLSSHHPTGFAWQNQWYPRFCSITIFRTLKITTCLERKLILFLGDSTLRQWLEYFMKYLKSRKTLIQTDFSEIGRLFSPLLENIQIHWKKHGHPFVTTSEYMTTDHSYAAREIDTVAGDKDTAIVVSLGQHFRPFPIELFIRRMINIREAVQRLFLRSPETKVIIKSENLRKTDIDLERFGDFHGYTQMLAVKDIFQGLNVGFIDAWDMSIAYDTSDVHPPYHVVGNQINLFLNYIC
uniref:NXPE C-terminal domain-containing protein n=1 Tax=Salvator merianae TaxID=96440 RepID=A0A8D0KNE3_SALMN